MRSLKKEGTAGLGEERKVFQHGALFCMRLFFIRFPVSRGAASRTLLSSPHPAAPLLRRNLSRKGRGIPYSALPIPRSPTSFPPSKTFPAEENSMPISLSVNPRDSSSG